MSVEGLVMKQSADSKLSLKDVILLDSQSTVSVFLNAHLVQDIRKAMHPLILQSNGGRLKLNKIATFAELGCEVWYSSREQLPTFFCWLPSSSNTRSLMTVTVKQNSLFIEAKMVWLIWFFECTLQDFISMIQLKKDIFLWRRWTAINWNSLK